MDYTSLCDEADELLNTKVKIGAKKKILQNLHLGCMCLAVRLEFLFRVFFKNLWSQLLNRVLYWSGPPEQFAHC